MPLDRVTITGADDNTDIGELINLSIKFPFVEWGILVSKKHEGSSRFPSSSWRESLMAAACDTRTETVTHAYTSTPPWEPPLNGQIKYLKERTINNPNISMHVCGEYVRKILTGKLEWEELPEIRHVAQRIQINTHAEEHVSTVSGINWMSSIFTRNFIIQLDGVNDHILDGAIIRSPLHPSAVKLGKVISDDMLSSLKDESFENTFNGLFDGSHGAGILPDEWPKPLHENVYYGYAGGLGPENVVEQVEKISKQTYRKFWIDMEGRVRTNEILDLDKVIQVLELCAPIVNGCWNSSAWFPTSR